MGKKLSIPTCPSCHNELRLKHSFSFWNPWNFPCPHCKVPLEASRIQKYIAFAVIPVGLLFAGIGIALERGGAWGPAGSLAFFALVVPLVVAGALVSWRHTRFTLKGK